VTSRLGFTRAVGVDARRDDLTATATLDARNRAALVPLMKPI
jgi:hypothetical protein